MYKYKLVQLMTACIVMAYGSDALECERGPGQPRPAEYAPGLPATAL